MNKFKNWLLNRDNNLLETMSREKMMEDDLDALHFAKRQKREEEELDEKIRIIKYLAQIKKKIESFVDAHDKGAQALKLVAAALLNHEKNREGIQTHVRSVYNKDLKSLKDLQKVFSHENLIKLFHDVDALHALTLVMDSDFESHLGNLEKDPEHGHIDHSHGELGKKFASFVVSHIKHAADDVLASFLQDHKKDEDQDDKSSEPDSVEDEEPVEAPVDQPDQDMSAGGGADVMSQDADQVPDDANMAQGAEMSQDSGDQGELAAGDMVGAEQQTGASDDNALMPPVGMSAQDSPEGAESEEAASGAPAMDVAGQAPKPNQGM